MLVNVSSRNTPLSPAARKLIVAAQGEIEPFFRRTISMDWTFEAERSRTTASCRLHSASGYYRASAAGRTAGEAIGEVVDRLLTQRRRRKAAILRGRHRAPARGRGWAGRPGRP